MSRINAGTIIAGIFAVLLALAGAYTVRQFLQTQQVTPVAQAPVDNTQVVPVASTDLMDGKTMKFGDVAVMRMTPEQIKQRKLPTDYMTDPQQIIGRILRASIKRGQPITPSDLFPDGTGPSVADKLKPGFRAVTVVVSDTGLTSGLVAPATFVDVLFRSTEREDFPETTYTVFEGVQVLAVGSASYPGSQADGRSGPSVNATLAVKPEDANVLKVLEGRGQLSLVLRSPEERAAGVIQADLEKVLEQLDSLEVEQNALESLKKLATDAGTPFEHEERLGKVKDEVAKLEDLAQQLHAELKRAQTADEKYTLRDVLGIPDPPPPIEPPPPKVVVPIKPPVLPSIDLYLGGQKRTMVFQDQAGDSDSEKVAEKPQAPEPPAPEAPNPPSSGAAAPASPDRRNVPPRNRDAKPSSPDDRQPPASKSDPDPEIPDMSRLLPKSNRTTSTQSAAQRPQDRSYVARQTPGPALTQQKTHPTSTARQQRAVAGSAAARLPETLRPTEPVVSTASPVRAAPKVTSPPPVAPEVIGSLKAIEQRLATMEGQTDTSTVENMLTLTSELVDKLQTIDRRLDGVESNTGHKALSMVNRLRAVDQRLKLVEGTSGTEKRGPDSSEMMLSFGTELARKLQTVDQRLAEMENERQQQARDAQQQQAETEKKSEAENRVLAATSELIERLKSVDNRLQSVETHQKGNIANPLQAQTPAPETVVPRVTENTANVAVGQPESGGAAEPAVPPPPVEATEPAGIEIFLGGQSHYFEPNKPGRKKAANAPSRVREATNTDSSKPRRETGAVSPPSGPAHSLMIEPAETEKAESVSSTPPVMEIFLGGAPHSSERKG